MYSVSSKYKNTIKEPSRSFKCKAIIKDNIYTNDDIVSLILETTQAVDGYPIGNTVSRSLELTILNNDDFVLSTFIVNLSLGLELDDGTVEYIPQGLFNIDDVEKTDYTIKYTCYDNMVKFETPFFTDKNTCTISEVISILSTRTGIAFTGTIENNYTVDIGLVNGCTCREVLGYIAALEGGNAYINREGKFTIVSINNLAYSINAENYITYTREDSEYKISKISCQLPQKDSEDKQVILESGTNDYMDLQFENPLMTQTILNNIYNKLKNVSFLGYSMKWQGDLSLDPMDVISCTDVKGVTRKLFIFSQKLTYNGGLTSEIGAKGQTENSNSFSSTGNTANKVNRLITEQAVIKEALINKANIQDLKATNAEIENLKTYKADIKDLTAINAEIKDLKASDATILDLVAGKADITDLNAANGKIDILESNVADIQTLVNGNLTSENIQSLILTSDKVTVADGFIKNAMIDNLDVSKINAGDISTTKFRIVSDSGKMIISDNTIQIRDSDRVRVQIGKDAASDYNMYVWDSEGKLMFDATGLKADGIKNKIIRDDMISDTANINGSKINISTLIAEINKDTNTSIIKSSKVQLDAEGQTLEVAFNNLKTTVDNINVGGKNLILNANFKKGIDVDWSKNTNFTLLEPEEDKPYSKILCYSKSDLTSDVYAQKWCKEIYIQDEGKTEFTYSFYVKSPNWDDVTPTSLLGCIRTFNEKGKISQADSVYYCNISLDKIEIEKVADKWIRVVVTVTPPQGKYIRFSLYASRNGTIYYREPKAELGNKATDFTVAQEDTDSAIESNTTSINVMQGNITTLISNTTIEKEGQTIQLKDAYSILEQTVDSISSIVSNHESSITDLKTTVSTQTSSIEQLQDSITTKVEKTYVDSSINSITIGGRNLQRYTDFSIDLLNKWTNVYAYCKKEYIEEEKAILERKTSEETGHLGIKAIAGSCLTLEKGKEYTLSVDIKGYNGTTLLNYIYLMANVSGVANQTLGTLTINEEFKRYSITFIPNKEYTSNATIMLGIRNATIDQGFYFKNFKLEEGNKATTYTAAPEDVNEKITEINNTISTQSSSITQLQNSITLKVEKTDIDEAIKNVSIGGVNLLEGTDFDRLTIDDVKKYWYTGYKLNTISFSSIGTFSEAYTDSTDDKGLIGKNYFEQKIDMYAANQNSNGQNYFNPIKNSKNYIQLKPNTTYTLSFWVYTNELNKNMSFTVWKYDDDGTNRTSHFNAGYFHESNEKFTKKEFTFTTDSNKFYEIRFYNNYDKTIAEGNCIVRLIDIQLEEGNKATTWTPSIGDDKLYTDKSISNLSTSITQTTDAIALRVTNSEKSISTLNGQVTKQETKISKVEQKITSEQLIISVSNGIKNGDAIFNTTKITMSTDGLTIYNGALTIKNNAEQNVLFADTVGNLTINGNFIQYDSAGKLALTLKDNALNIYDWNGVGGLVGSVSAAKSLKKNMYGVGIIADYNDYISIGYRPTQDSKTTFNSFVEFSQQSSSSSDEIYVNFWRSIGLKGYNDLKFLGNDENITLGTITLNTNNQFSILCNGDVTDKVLIGGRRGNLYETYLDANSGGITVYGNMACTGAKPRVVQTNDYGWRMLSAYETAEPIFGDIGEGIINDEGYCYIYLDPVFLETVNTKCQYQVFLQPYSNEGCFPIERKEDYFVVKGVPGTKFAWEIKAKQKGYEFDRLETMDIEADTIKYCAEELDEYDIGELGQEYYDEYERKMLNEY